MLLDGIIRKRIASLLQPWLRGGEEPEFELQLGFINSRLIAKNLRLDDSALNRLLDESSCFAFREASVEVLSIRFSNWSVPAFEIETHGVNVVLSAGEEKEEGSLRRVRKSSEVIDKEKKKTIARIDPEGSALHDLLQKMLVTNGAKSGFMASLVNLFLKHCHLQMYNTNLQVHIPMLGDPLVCLFDLKELNLESQYYEHECLFRAFIGMLLKPLRQTSLLTDFRGFEIGYKMKDHRNQVFFSRNLFTCFQLNDLKLVNFNARIPELSGVFTPLDFLAILSASDKLSSQAHFRNGRQLWRLAINRLGYTIPSPRLSLHNVVQIVCLWLRYLNAYERLLSVIGSSAESLMKESAVKISWDKNFLNSVKHNWEEISCSEKDLPAEAIAQARRIARYRAAMNVQHGEDSYKESSINSRFKIFSKVIPVLFMICAIVGKIFHSIVHFLLLIGSFFQEPKVDGHLGIEGYYPPYSFLLNCGKILISISPTNIGMDANESIKSHIGISYSDVHSFCLSIDALLLAYVDENFEQSLCISCGQFEVKKSSVNMERSSHNVDDTERANDSKRVLWVEPANMFLSSQPSENRAAYQNEGVCNPSLNKHLGEMCSNWKSSFLKYDENEVEYSENPWFLCEIKISVKDPGLKSMDPGFWKCCLTVGKLSLDFGYLSIMSMAILLGQIKQALNWNEDKGSASILSHSRPTNENQQLITWEREYESFANRMKMTLFGMLPEKIIHLGVYISGPHIKLSLAEVGFSHRSVDINHVVSQDNFYLGFDIHDIEAFVWPTSESDSTVTGWAGTDDTEPECPKLLESQIVEIPKPYNEKFVAQGKISLVSHLRVNGFNIYIGDLKGQHGQIFISKPIAIRIVLLRKSLHSFSTTVNALSAAFCGTASGFSIISYMDELYVLLQGVEDLSSAIPYALGVSSRSGSVIHRDLVRQDVVVFTGLENEERSVEVGPWIDNSSLLNINGAFKVKPMDITLDSSRKKVKVESSIKNYNSLSFQKVSANDLPDSGICVSACQTSFEISCDEEKLELLLELEEMQCVLFNHGDLMGEGFDYTLSRNLLQQPQCWSAEISLSNCTFTLWLAKPHNSLNNSFGTSRLGDDTQYVKNNQLAAESETSSSLSGRFAEFGFTSHIFSPPANHWISVNAILGGIFVARSLVKNFLFEAHQLNKLTTSLSAGGSLQTISWGMKGGLLLFETRALMMFSQCFASYLCYIDHLYSIVKSSINLVENYECETHGGLQRTQQPRWKLPETLTVDVSQFSFALVVTDDTGGVKEIVIEVDVLLKLESVNMQRKCIFNLSRMSIFSHILTACTEKENQFPHPSLILKEAISHSVSGDPPVEFQQMDGSSTSHEKHILEHLIAVISVESKNGPLPEHRVWVGDGSVSGFDMTFSLSDIQMIYSIISSFSTESKNETGSDPKPRDWSSNQEMNQSFEDIVPNGAIVSIKDVHQHMYFAVEEREDKLSLVGVVHYSLVGERALFRVKHHKQRIWRSSVLWFSLISLYAKSKSGEPLQLNYHPGSGFVDLSSSKNDAGSLWKIVSHEQENYHGDVDQESYHKLVKDTFYLVNKKNDCAVAFTDGVPEFVRKPGNPIKFKVFHGIVLPSNVAQPDAHSLQFYRADQHHVSHVVEGQNFMQSGSFPSICIEIERVTFTLIDELADSKERFLLLRGFIDKTHINVQILAYKTRIMSKSIASLNYFDAQRTLWRELIHPVEICIFYRSNFQLHGPGLAQHGVPVHFYCRTKEWDLSLTEHSLDILLFVIGRLNLAGPFSVRSSVIFANCCKVENHTGLFLLCRFCNEKSVTVARKQSTSIFLRYPQSENQPPESVPVVAIQLSNLGSFVTSSFNLSLQKTRAFTWRTRIMSLQDSRTYPGPFVVVDISRKSEDGLSIVVSPLIRIHNETGFSLELRFLRPEQDDDIFASFLLKKGDSIDDTKATFDAISSSGGLKKVLMSLSVGNFLFSFRPEIAHDLINSGSPLSAEWSDELKGGKAVHISGIFDKLGHEVRRALSVESGKYSFSTTSCTLKSGDVHVANLHFLIQSIGRDLHISQPDKSSYDLGNRISGVAIREQKEIFLLPTVNVSNLLHSEIHVLLSDTDMGIAVGNNNIGKEATIPCGSTADFYANPATIYFTVTLNALRSSCKPVNSGDWVKKLLKKKPNVHYLDIDLDFDSGKYFASLRLSRGLRGTLEASIFTSYSFKNESGFSLFLSALNQKRLSRDEVSKFGSDVPPELGLFLPPNSIKSWFSKSQKVRLKVLEDYASEARLDLDALSGLTEITFEVEKESQVKYLIKFGVSTGLPLSAVVVPSQTVTLVPRHVVFNESDESITVRQCYMEHEIPGIIIRQKHRAILKLQNGISKSKEFSLFENVLRKHRNDTQSEHIQFRLNEPESDWSGPVCVASLGRFFLKFRKQSNQAQVLDNSVPEFAVVHVVEEGSSLVVHFCKPPNISLPYRIENQLNDTWLTYYQKDSSEREVLGSYCSASYVWDDLTLPHKLVVLVNDRHLLREINLDKIRAWRPFHKVTQKRGFSSHSLVDKKPREQKTYFGQLSGMEIVKVGYEVYAEGATRVLRICEVSQSKKGSRVIQPSAKIQLRVSHFAIHLLGCEKQDSSENEEASYAPIMVLKLRNINLNSLFTEEQKYNQIEVQSLNVDLKWIGAPFAAMLRRHQLDFNDSNASLLTIVVVLLPTSSNVCHIKYSSIVLKPVDLNLDEETLMRVAYFWRTSLSDSSNPSQQYYFDYFEIHPIKIIANFLPGESYSSYNSAQETLRSLLHSIVKVPPIKNMVVELNGVLVTNALITVRELCIRCAQHYSWYALRAIYIAKGSPLLPPAFASMFDDLASSSLDVFFDPSHGLINLPGLTLGSFKFISKCINDKGFSGTKRYFGDLGKTFRTLGSNVLFTAVTEISDSVLKGAETSGFDGMLTGFHQGILKLAMEPSVLGTAVMGGGPDRKIKLDRSTSVDELYIEGYLQAMLDSMYRQEYLRVRVIDDQVILKNLPPNSALINEIMNRVKEFLVSKALLKGDASTSSRPLRHLRAENEWKIGPTVMTLCEHLLVSFAIRKLRKHTGKFLTNVNWKVESESEEQKKAIVPAEATQEGQKGRFVWKWGIGKFVLSGMLAYVDGRLCRSIPNPVVRRIVSGYLLSFLDKNDG